MRVNLHLLLTARRVARNGIGRSTRRLARAAAVLLFLLPPEPAQALLFSCPCPGDSLGSVRYRPQKNSKGAATNTRLLLTVGSSWSYTDLTLSKDLEEDDDPSVPIDIERIDEDRLLIVPREELRAHRFYTLRGKTTVQQPVLGPGGFSCPDSGPCGHHPDLPCTPCMAPTRTVETYRQIMRFQTGSGPDSEAPKVESIGFSEGCPQRHCYDMWVAELVFEASDDWGEEGLLLEAEVRDETGRFSAFLAPVTTLRRLDYSSPTQQIWLGHGEDGRCLFKLPADVGSGPVAVTVRFVDLSGNTTVALEEHRVELQECEGYHPPDRVPLKTSTDHWRGAPRGCRAAGGTLPSPHLPGSSLVVCLLVASLVSRRRGRHALSSARGPS